MSGVASDDAGTGASNPELAENGTVALHPGIDGTGADADLTPEAHGFEQPVAKIEVTRIAQYEVTVENLTQTQPFTPPVLATHDSELSVFAAGDVASEGVREIAENGNVAPLEQALSETDGVFDVQVTLGDPPPLLPEQTRSTTITADGLFDQASLVSMLICTNDGFTGVDSLKLPLFVGQSTSATGPWI